MKKLGLVSLAAMACVWVVGCGSSDAGGETKNVGAAASAAKARFSSGPSATLTKDNSTRVLAETKRQQSSGTDAMKGNPLGGGGGQSSTKSLGIRSLGVLDASSAGTASCPDIAADKDQGSCACPGGGKLSYDIPNLKALKSAKGDSLPDEIDIALAYDGCSMGNKKYGGSMAMVISKKSVVGVAKDAKTAAPAATSGMNMLIVANDLTIGDERLDFAFAMEGGKLFYAPSVDDKGGYVLTELSFTGATKVHAKNGTYECTASACKSEDGKDTIPIAADPKQSKDGG